MQRIIISTLVATIIGASILIVGCGSNNSSTETTSDSTSTKMADTVSQGRTALKPTGNKPEWGPSIHPEMQAVIEKLASFNAPPIESLTADSARKNPTPADAVMALAKEQNIPIPVPQVDTLGKEIPVAGGNIHARIYIPKGSTDSLPVIVYYHGGGFVIATIDTYDASAVAMAEQAKAIVVAVEYRKAPEHKFPTAHNDAFAAYQWVLKNAAAWKGQTAKIGLVGESAGGNLAANVAIMARDKKITRPVYQVLVYPIASDNMNSASYTKYAMAKPLNKAMMEWFTKKYLPSMATAADSRIALVKANLKGLPATTIITAEIDPLQDDGKALADALKAAGVEVNYKNYDGVTHEFFGMALLVPEAKEAQGFAADGLKKAFSK